MGRGITTVLRHGLGNPIAGLLVTVGVGKVFFEPGIFVLLAVSNNAIRLGGRKFVRLKAHRYIVMVWIFEDIPSDGRLKRRNESK